MIGSNTTRTCIAALSVALALAACKPSSPARDNAATADAAAASTAPASAGDAAPASGDSRQALRDVFEKLGAVRSYQIVTTTPGGGPMDGTTEIVTPDRSRMTLQDGSMVITVIGQDSYTTMQGKTTKSTIPAEVIDPWKDPAARERQLASATVEDQGSETVDGTATRKYLVHMTDPVDAVMTLWVGKDGLPVQQQISAEPIPGQKVESTMRYSRFNDPSIQIEAPQ